MISMILHVYLATLLVGLVANVIAFALGRVRAWIDAWPFALRLVAVFGAAALIVYGAADASGTLLHP
jgi:hypothetical protein